MPLRSIVMALSALELMLEILLACERTDRRDLCITDTELGGVVEHWVGVEG